MNEIIFLVNEPPEGGYAAEAQGHAIFATAGTLALIRRNASRSRTLSQQAGHWWNSRSGMV